MSIDLDLRLHPKQRMVLETEATEILYGGSAGSGKSHLVRVMAILACLAIPNCQVYLFRKNKQQILDNHVDTPSGFPTMLEQLVKAGYARPTEDGVRFKHNGSLIHYCHLNHVSDLQKYQGAEIHLLLLDESTHFTWDEYKYLRTRVRAVGLSHEDPKILGFDSRKLVNKIVCTTNPGGVGHADFKAQFVDHGSAIWKVPDEDGGRLRQFIPALLEDNPTLMEQVPDYGNSLLGLGGKMAQALRYGNWDILEGQFFPFDSTLHVVRPFMPHRGLKVIRSFDWGYAKPFSHGWSCLMDGMTPITMKNGDMILPRKNAVVRFREWYGKDNKKSNAGVQMIPEHIAAGVLARQTRDEQIHDSVADRAFYNKSRGKSIAETWAEMGLRYRPANDDRVQGWQQCVSRLTGVGGLPDFFVTSNCLDYLRTIPQMVHDEKRPDDIDSDLEDHLADEWRYSIMSREQYATERTVGNARREHDQLEDLDKLYASLEDRQSRSYG
jgi:hypothetical protein